MTGTEEGTKHLQDAGDHTICCDYQSQSAERGTYCQLAKAGKLGILDMSPKDEVEGELLYYQLQLLGTGVSRKQLSGDFFIPLFYVLYILIMLYYSEGDLFSQTI